MVVQILQEIPASKPVSRFSADIGGSDIELLHSISTALIGEQDRATLYAMIVDAAVAIMDSQFGTMQLFLPPGDPSGHGGELQLLYSCGLPPECARFWQWVNPTSQSSCALALKLGQRAIVSDFEKWDEIADTEGLAAFRRAGIRSAQTTPLVSRNGALLGMLSTHWCEPHRPSERDLRLLDILARQAADLLDRMMADEVLRARERELEKACASLQESEDRSRLLASIVESGADAIVTKDLDGTITSWNRGAELLFGYTAKEVIGKPVTILMPADRKDEEPVILGRIRRGENIEHYETIRRRKDGSLLDISLTVPPLRDAKGTIVGASKIARDVTERKRADFLVATLAREAEHRTKNVLARVAATVNLSRAKTADELKQVISGRIHALAEVHSLFVKSRWTGADLAAIIAQELSPYQQEGKDRVQLEGPSVLLSTETAQTLAISIHELTTNAGKYGALSTPQGCLRVDWSNSGSESIKLRWAETGGPAVDAPSSSGFGTDVVRRVIDALDGTIESEWRPEGLVCEITLPR